MVPATTIVAESINPTTTEAALTQRDTLNEENDFLDNLDEEIR